MIARLLCPGPSLADYRHEDGFDGLVVGVNRAATRVACDAWVCGDPPLIQQEGEDVIGAPELVTSVDGFQVYRDFPRNFGKPLWRGAARCWTDMLDYCPHALDWVMFSATAALIYCGWRGADQVDVYGADWKGIEDFDGELAGKNRSEGRWRLEAGIWQNRLVPWLLGRGVVVNRRTVAQTIEA